MYYNKSKEEIFSIFSTSDNGLSESQVAENREKHGTNKLYEKKKKSLISIFLGQFKDLLVIILIGAAIISMVTGNIDSAVVIFTVLILNAILGTVQYVKAEKSLDSLKSLSSPIAKVIRNGVPLEIPAEDLVCGDIIRLDAGDVIPGDARIIMSHSLKLNESALTGESEPVDKKPDTISETDIAIGDRTNMVFSSSLVTYGRGLAVVTGVGVNTELGKIADLMNSTKERKTPLQITMDNFSKKLSIGIILICLIVFGLSIYRNMPITDALLFAVALAVAAIPEALSSIITISLAIGTKRMADQNAIIKELNAVESLGCVSIICSDKTGTLTQNKMTVQKVISNADMPPETLDELLLSSILCNDTQIVDGTTTGDPTETALVDYYIAQGNDYSADFKKYRRLSELPFDSDRKLMTTLHHIDGKFIAYTKGALDVILSRSSNVSPEAKERISDVNFELSNSGLRVLAFAKRQFEDDKQLMFEDESDLILLGIIAMMDPPRDESAQAVKDCKMAGIKPIMITGDHKITASAIAKSIGIFNDGDMAVTGPELDAMSEEELMSKLERISVYARVSPDNKIRIVRAWQSLGHIVAMTGDGVNDGPALRSADVGVAMGITGTEVAKDSASMILTDDNFATIIKSVVNGRNIYANIKNAIKFLLSGNAAGILVVLYASLLNLPTPFTAVQLLFINLITDSLPALAISMEPHNSRLIKEKPRSRQESVLTRSTVIQILLQGVVLAAATVIAFHLGLEKGPVFASTMAFATLCLGRLWHGFNSRGDQNIFALRIFSNMYTIGAFILGALLLFALLLLPFFETAFGIAPVTGQQIGAIWALSFAPTLIIQIIKIIRDARRK